MPKRPLPTAERLRELMDYDPMTGRLIWRKRSAPRANRIAAGDEVGSLMSEAAGGYLETSVDSVRLRVHRVIWCWMTGSYPAALIDHIDGNRTNNAWANLRDATSQINLENIEKARKDSGTGLRGVHKKPPKGKGFGAGISSRGVHYWLGTFPTPEEASAAYKRAKAVLHTGWVPRDKAAMRERVRAQADASS